MRPAAGPGVGEERGARSGLGRRSRPPPARPAHARTRTHSCAQLLPFPPLGPSLLPVRLGALARPPRLPLSLYFSSPALSLRVSFISALPSLPSPLSLLPLTSTLPPSPPPPPPHARAHTRTPRGNGDGKRAKRKRDRGQRQRSGERDERGRRDADGRALAARASLPGSAPPGPGLLSSAVGGRGMGWDQPPGRRRTARREEECVSGSGVSVWGESGGGQAGVHGIKQRRILSLCFVFPVNPTPRIQSLGFPNWEFSMCWRMIAEDPFLPPELRNLLPGSAGSPCPAPPQRTAKPAASPAGPRGGKGSGLLPPPKAFTLPFQKEKVANSSL